MIDNHDGTQIGKESYFDCKTTNAKRIFEYALKKIRDKNLYQIDSDDKKCLYGEYEP